MTAIPASWAAPGPFSTAGFPSTVSWPSSGWYTPARIFTSVDLPAPFSPTSPCASPPYRSIDPSTIACTAPNDLTAPRSDSSGAPSPRPGFCAAATCPAGEPVGEDGAGEDCAGESDAAESPVDDCVAGVAEGAAGP